MSITSSWFRSGTVSVTKGQRVVQGFSSAWVSHLTPIGTGDAFTTDFTTFYEVVEVVSDTQIKLDRAYAGTTATKVPYAIVRNGSSNFSVRTASAVQKSLAWYQEQLGIQNKLLTEDGDVVIELPTGESITLWSEKKKQAVFEAHDASLTEMYKKHDASLKELQATNHFGMRSQADMEAMREANNAMFAASGFVHMGKHYGSSSEISIGNGLNTTLTIPNSLRMGRRSSDGLGLSKEAFAHLNMAGLVSEIQGHDVYGLQIKFPAAEAGTRTYDSATGVSFDYAKEVDPKYGDIAPTRNEAVSRAWEGMVANGDFRFPLKDTSLGAWNGLSNNHVNITGNTLVIDGVSSGSNLSVVQKLAGTVKAGVTYRVSVTKKSGSGTSSANLSKNGQFDASLTIYRGMEEAGTYSLDYTPTEDGALYIQLYGLQQYGGVPVGPAEITNVSCTPLTREVVTDRVDMWGFEGWLELITPTNPYVYKHGLIQSQATDIEGVATSSSNRPDSYYAAYDGDTTSRGKCVNFFALSVLEQDAIANNPKNHIYRMKNGDICQWRVRQRTFAGAGNGDWAYIADYRILGFSAGCYVWPQGKKDAQQAYGTSARLYVGDNDSLKRKRSTSKGIFEQVYDNTVSYNGECYFLVGGTVSRLNSGAYHPSLNPMGAAQITLSTVGTRNWHEQLGGKLAAEWLVTASDAFKVSTGPANPGKYNGNILSEASGRPDGRFFDCIYASGAGGVIDLRLSAWDASSVEKAAEIDAQVKAGTYRGLEKLVYTDFIPQSLLGGGTSPDKARKYGVYASTKALGLYLGPWESGLFAVGDTLIVIDKTLSRTFKGVINTIGTTTGYVSTALAYEWISASSQWMPADVSTNVYGTGNDVHVFVERKTNISISGEFIQTDVMGDPADILQCVALKYGWLGSWVQHDTSNRVAVSRKMVASFEKRLYTNDHGATWNAYSSSPDLVKNTVYSNAAAGNVEVHTYTAFAKQTVASVRSPVLHREAGVGSGVYTHQRYLPSYGVLLGESLLGKVLTSNTGVQTVAGNYTIQKLDFLDNGSLNNSRPITHLPIDDFAVPQNNSPALKSLRQQAEVSGQATLEYLFNELKHDGSSWGDTGAVVVADNTTVYTNDNGETCLAGTARLALPYGWVKNNF